MNDTEVSTRNACTALFLQKLSHAEGKWEQSLCPHQNPQGDILPPRDDGSRDLTPNTA